MTVTFYAWKDDKAEPFGSISLQGKQLILNPPDSSYLREVATEYVRVDGEWIKAEADPKRWLRALPRKFSGSYLWAELTD